MICRNCGDKYAPFPKEDFNYVEIHNHLGLHVHFEPKNKKAEERRKRVFDSNTKGFCSEECEQVYNAEYKGKRQEVNWASFNS